MNLLEQIQKCSTNDEIDKIIDNAIRKLDKNGKKIDMIGYDTFSTKNKVFKLSIETYGMETTDFLYEFAHKLKKYNIDIKGNLIRYLETFIVQYFGVPKGISRENIFELKASQTTTTDEEYFEALEKMKLAI